MKAVLFLVATAIYVNADVYDCSGTGKCPPGMKCESGRCIVRLDCPQRGIPIVGPGCKLVDFVDENGCPKSKVVCNGDKSI
ncbi:hypothetical protein NECAME_14308 [Necator americanus]|uniref:Uncharacterized protein n=1 Tax=Necator americanus TaxID=51031 RepID=W2SRG7_NECAM|nr:hypothetical protein NECAME_14308 [Necator americanus]ETN71267.1 hypothetical protein NECAME_14308 [Necator americanus]